MDRPPTPAGPVFKTLGPSFHRETTKGPLTAHKRDTSVLRDGIESQRTQTVVFDLHKSGNNGFGFKKPLEDITNGRRYVKPAELPAKGWPRKDMRIQTLPFVGERPSTGILKSRHDKENSQDPNKLTEYGSSRKFQRHLPLTPKKMVQFEVSGQNESVAPCTSAKSGKGQSGTSSYQVKGTAISKEERDIDVTAGRKIRVIRRAQNNTSGALSLFRRKLQQNLETRFTTDTTALQPECVVRRQDSSVRMFPPRPPHSWLSADPHVGIQHPHTGSKTGVVTENNNKHTEQASAKETPNNDSRPKPDRSFSYKLAEKAEEYFTRNLRHLQETPPKPNIIQTYVVEGNPKDFLEKMDKAPAVSLTTKNLETHNSWWTTLDARQSFNWKVTPREVRIRRWIEEMQGSSRHGHTRVVNIVVKDRGCQAEVSKEDPIDRMSQVMA